MAVLQHEPQRIKIVLHHARLGHHEKQFHSRTPELRAAAGDGGGGAGPGKKGYRRQAD
jgi:hypothetical protein